MKILILANADIGLIKFRKELLIELVKKYEVIVSVPKGEYYQDILDIGCSVIDAEFDRHNKNPFKDILLYKKYVELIKKVRPSIVFTYTIKPNVYGGMACARFNVPYVANITGLGTAVENGGILQKIALLLYKIGLRKAQKVFFQNVDNKEFMISRKIVNTPYEILPGSGVNLDDFSYVPYPNCETIDFLFVARIMKEKGIEQYMDAAKTIRIKHPETRFHICGFCEQDYEAELNRLNNEGVIIYHGLVKDMKPMYAMASCVVHPTYYPEGLSNVLLEGSATGRPIITTNRAGCKEVISDGVNGYICKEKNSQDLIDKLEAFLALSWEDKKMMGQKGRSKVEKEFSRKIILEKYLGEIE